MTTATVRPDGPMPARVMIVGEAPGAEEERLGVPFVGASGQELNRMLHEAGIARSECFVTNVVRVRPPNNNIGFFIALKKKDITLVHVPVRDKYVLPIVQEGIEQLEFEIRECKPQLIIAFGNVSMWALTGKWGITKWRGSELVHHSGAIVLPTIHPAGILRAWDMRAIVVNDLRRAKRVLDYGSQKPDWQFIIRPSFEKVTDKLDSLLRVANEEELWIAPDIETKAGHIDCIGFAWSKLDALCIPLMSKQNRAGYWNEEEEAIILYKIYRLFTHPNVKIKGQNWLYDCQYFYRHLHFIPNCAQDTMISQHSLFCALQKSLDFLASMYARWYCYWKDERGSDNEDDQWVYNCEDCVYTYEVGDVLKGALAAQGRSAVDETQQALFFPVLRAMLRGVRVLPAEKAKLAMEIQEELSARESFLFAVLGHTINPGSPKQMQALFYDDLKQKPIMKRVFVDGHVVMRPTVDDEALTQLAVREPLVKPICNAIADIRTLSKWLKDFVMMPVDTDGRMRCSFNIAGDAGDKKEKASVVKSAPYSYRLSSSENAFGSGGNLQTIPSEKSKSAGKAAARGSMDFALPNIRAMYGPDPGFTFFDMDLDRADLQVVVWESDDEMLKAALKMGADIHLLNVYSLDGRDPPPLEELVEDHPMYLEHRTPRKHKREFAKVFCHATNYLGKAKTVAAHTGRLVHEIERAQAAWFGAHPGIKSWHERVIAQVNRHRFVENKFGYRWNIFDRIDEQLYPKAVAWIPQSTVGIVINKAWIKIDKALPEVQVLIQVHDSLAGQFPSHLRDWCIKHISEESKILIPYEDPLIIPTGIKTSNVSWGACK